MSASSVAGSSPDDGSSRKSTLGFARSSIAMLTRLPTRKIGDALMGVGREAQPRDHPENQRVYLVAGQAQAQPGAEGDGVRHRKFLVNDVVLRNEADSNFAQARAVRERHASDPHFAGGGRVNPTERVQ